MKRGKKYNEAAKLVTKGATYDVAEACALIKKTATAKFDETIECHIRTGCDGRHADQQIRGAVVLPHGTGKTVRVLVFARDAKAEEAVQNYVQAIINSFMNGKLITKEQHDKIVSEERYSAAKEAANDIRFRHGPGGC